MKYLRIILLYITVIIAGCMGTQVPEPEQPDPNIVVTCRNDTETRKIVWIYDYCHKNTNIAAGEVQPGEDIVFAKLGYNHTYDMKWGSSWPKYQTLTFYSFRVRAGKVFILSTPLKTIFKYGSIDSDFDFSDNTKSIKRTGPNYTK